MLCWTRHTPAVMVTWRNVTWANPGRVEWHEVLAYVSALNAAIACVYWNQFHGNLSALNDVTEFTDHWPICIASAKFTADFFSQLMPFSLRSVIALLSSCDTDILTFGWYTITPRKTSRRSPRSCLGSFRHFVIRLQIWPGRHKSASKITFYAAVYCDNNDCFD